MILQSAKIILQLQYNVALQIFQHVMETASKTIYNFGPQRFCSAQLCCNCKIILQFATLFCSAKLFCRLQHYFAVQIFVAGPARSGKRATGLELGSVQRSSNSTQTQLGLSPGSVQAQHKLGLSSSSAQAQFRFSSGSIQVQTQHRLS